MKILFLHGWNSVPGGVKPTHLKDHGHEVINPKLPDDDFAGAVRIAQAEWQIGRSDDDGSAKTTAPRDHVLGRKISTADGVITS